MPRVIITMVVEDPETFAGSVSRRKDIYRMLTASSVHYNVQGDGEIVLCLDIGDLDSFYSGLRSQTMMETLAVDGVVRKHVKISVLDQELELGLD